MVPFKRIENPWNRGLAAIKEPVVEAPRVPRAPNVGQVDVAAARDLPAVPPPPPPTLPTTLEV